MNRNRSRQRIQIGDVPNGVFDTEFHAYSNAPEKIKRVLNRDLHIILIESLYEKEIFEGDLRLQHRILSYSEPGDMISEKTRLRFEAMIDVLTTMAEGLKA